MMNVSFTSKVTLLDDEKSRKSYLEDNELQMLMFVIS